MIETLFELDLLDTPEAFFASLVIGLLFGIALERAGFGSSRRLAGIFYLRDMAVLKVMFTALVTAMLGLALVESLGIVGPGALYRLPTVYGAQVVGGLLFGVGFAMGGWCPGTAAVGAASGKVDAVVFLGGAVAGSILFNELFPVIEPLYRWGLQEEPLVAFGIGRSLFAFLLTLAAVASFWFAEWVEKGKGGGTYLGSPFLKVLGAGFVFFAMALFIFPDADGVSAGESAGGYGPRAEAELLRSIEAADDHVEPEELADRLMRGEPDLHVVDVRPPQEFATFHISGALNIPLEELPVALGPYRDRGTIVLYSNGMTHPAQARDALERLGFGNVYHLTDGLAGFVSRCLTPVSLREEPLTDALAEKVRAWRSYFIEGRGPRPEPTASPKAEAVLAPATFPGYVTTEWLAENLGRPDVRVIDLRDQKDYNGGHLEGSVCLNSEAFRGVVGGVSSMLLPAKLVAGHLSLLGISPGDSIVLVAGDKVRDATLVGMGLSRVGHPNWGLLYGGFAAWKSEGRPLVTTLPEVRETDYPVPAGPDTFTADYRYVLERVGDGRTVILDVRPPDYFQGKKSEEARAGHIPGALNRSFESDLGEGGRFLTIPELTEAYARLIPARATPVVVHCRTGHQGSQTYFVMKHLLGYSDVMWYDAGWAEWAARPELPVKE